MLKQIKFGQRKKFCVKRGGNRRLIFSWATASRGAVESTKYIPILLN